jgi:hypothetical protein
VMHGHEKSDSVIVAMKPANTAEQSAAESAEPRTGTKGLTGNFSNGRFAAHRGKRSRHFKGKFREPYRGFESLSLRHCHIRG